MCDSKMDSCDSSPPPPMEGGSQQQTTGNVDRAALYYMPDECLPANAQTDVGDQFYEVTPDDLRTRHKDLVNRVKLETNRPFLPRTYLERKNRELRERAYKNAVIRFSVQNRFVIQARFLSSEPVSHLIDFVRSVLRDNTRFELRLVRERIAEDATKSLLQAELAPASRLMLKLVGASDDITELINVQALTKSTEQAADVERHNWLSSNTEFHSFESMLAQNDIELRENAMKRAAALILGGNQPKTSGGGSGPSGTSSSSSSASRTAQTPKWFKKN